MDDEVIFVKQVQKKHTGISRDMQKHMDHYLMIENLEESDTNSSILNFLNHTCQLPQAVRVKVLYNKSIKPRMCCVQFSVPLTSSLCKQKKANGKLIYSNVPNNESLILEDVISKIHKHLKNDNLKCRPLRKNDVELFMRKPKSNNGNKNTAANVYPTLIDHIVTHNQNSANPLDIIYIIDFEMAVGTSDLHLPLEMSAVKFSLHNRQIIDSFHFLIKQKEQIPQYLENTARYTRNFIHGIPTDTGTDDHVDIWRKFLNFVGIKSEQDTFSCVLVAKDPKAENGCLRWFYKVVADYNSAPNGNKLPFCFDHIKEFNVVLDLSHFLSLYQPSLTEELITIANKLVVEHLNQQHKCEFHQIASPSYHCALEDCYAVAHMIKSSLESDNWSYLKESQITMGRSTGNSRLLAYKKNEQSNKNSYSERPTSPSFSEEVADDWNAPQDKSIFFE
jgi:hypothetical protein